MVGIYGISKELIDWLEDTFPNKLPTDSGMKIDDCSFN